MRGFPKTIGSKQDVENLLAMPEMASQARAKLNELEGGSQVWVPVKELGKAEAGVTSDSQKVVIQKTEDGQEKRLQMELKDDPQAPFIRLGLAALKPVEPISADSELLPKLTEGVKDA